MGEHNYGANPGLNTFEVHLISKKECALFARDSLAFLGRANFTSHLYWKENVY
jgi:hypothetical protein